MATVTLEEFIERNRNELIRRCRAKVLTRSPSQSDTESEHGVPRFLAQLVEELRDGPSQSRDIGKSAVKHGRDLLLQGFTVGQVVHGYGDVCQSVTELSIEMAAPIDSDDFRTLNRCLDDAIAGAVTEHARGSHEHDQASTPGTGSRELRSLTETALVAFEALQRGNVGIGGSTGAVLQRSLMAMRDLASRPLSAVIEAEPR